jgi:MFS transporter, DHA1 family, inner membrane transport protein
LAEGVSTPPGARTHPALAILTLALGGFGIGTTEFVSMGLLPDMARDVHVSIPDAGHVISAYALGVVVGAPLLAALGARVPRRTMLIGLMAAFALGNATSALAPSYGSLVLARFVSGLPHGAYFGVAALVAASLMPPHRRARAVGAMMLGLSVANVVGVPAATWLGQVLGWRSAYWAVTVIGALSVLALTRWAPRRQDARPAGVRRELGALGQPQVWLTLLVGTVGFGGMFATYTYIAPTMTEVAGMGRSAVPLVLALYGVGMVSGNIVGGWAADRGVVAAMFAGMSAVAVVLAVFTVAVRNPWTGAAVVTLVGLSGAALVPALQTRLMDVAGHAQTLAASLNHAALNIANALGAWLGGVVIALGWGFASTGWVGVVLALLGLGVLAVSWLLDRRTRVESAEHDRAVAVEQHAVLGVPADRA